MPLDDGRLAAWCRVHLNAEPVERVFEAGYLSSVVGLLLADGRRVVVKARPPSARVRPCHSVHGHLWRAGYPCPEPLVEPTPLGSLLASAETLVEGGETLGRVDGADIAYAEALARLTRLAPPPETAPDLAECPAWLNWRHREPGIWPLPDDATLDLNGHPGPRWLDELGRLTRARLLISSGAPVIGHGDWWSSNLRWIGLELHCVHDWDSLVILSEAAIVGEAAANYLGTGEPGFEPSIGEAQSFIDQYVAARRLRWDEDDHQVAWAAGLWVKAFNAKKESVWGQGGTPIADRLAAEARDWAARAGVPWRAVRDTDV